MRLLLVDGHYYLYRSFFAIRGLTNSRGEPTNAIYGFTKALRKMVLDTRADLGAVIWDSGLSERRTSLQSHYKQQRPEMPAEMRSQEAILIDLVPAIGLASIRVPKTEADDLIASYTKSAVAAGHQVIIATSDKDLLQLTTSSVSIYSTNKAHFSDAKAGFALLGPPEVTARWGVRPEQIGDVLALTGDSSDNIRGVAGIGEKTAAALICEHGSLQALLANLDRVKNAKLRGKLDAARSVIEENASMVALDDSMDLPIPIDHLQISPRYPEFISALRMCEFKSLLVEVEKEAEAAGGSRTASQRELF